MSTVSIVTLDITQLNVQISQIVQKDISQDNWGSYTATGSTITEKEQLLCNTHFSTI